MSRAQRNPPIENRALIHFGYTLVFRKCFQMFPSFGINIQLFWKPFPLFGNKNLWYPKYSDGIRFTWLLDFVFVIFSFITVDPRQMIICIGNGTDPAEALQNLNMTDNIAIETSEAILKIASIVRKENKTTVSTPNLESCIVNPWNLQPIICHLDF